MLSIVFCRILVLPHHSYVALSSQSSTIGGSLKSAAWEGWRQRRTNRDKVTCTLTGGHYLWASRAIQRSLRGIRKELCRAHCWPYIISCFRIFTALVLLTLWIASAYGFSPLEYTRRAVEHPTTPALPTDHLLCIGPACYKWNTVSANLSMAR